MPVPPSGFPVRPGTITLRLGASVPTEGLQPGDRHELARRARDAVAAMLAPSAIESVQDVGEPVAGPG